MKQKQSFVKNPMVKFVGIFAVSCIVLQILFHLPAIVEPFMYFTAKVTHFLVTIFDSNITLSGYHIIGVIDMEIIYECTGIYGLIILLSGFYATWFPWEEKVIVSMWGLVAIFCINQVRLISIFFITSKWPSSFEILHTYFWQLFLILFVCIIYFSWFKRMNEKYSKNEKKHN